jgi:MFS family permease
MTATHSTPGIDERVPEPSPWRDRTFLIFAAGNTFNNLGEAIYAVALPLLVYDLTGSLAVMSLLAAVVPASLLLGPLLGVAVDRWGPRALVLPGLLLQLAAAVVLNLVGLSTGAPVGLLFALAVLIQLGGVAYQTGWMAGVATMFPAQPARARGSLSSLFVATRIAGAVLFAAALPGLGYPGLLWLNVLTFAAPIMVWCLGIRPPQPAARTTGPAGSVRPELLEGWQLLRANRPVIDVTVIVLPVMFVGSVGTATLAIFQLRNHWQLGASEVAAVLTASRIGGLLATLAVSQRRRLPPRWSFVVAALGIAAALFAMASPWLGLLIVGLVLLTTVQSALAVATQMIVFKQVPAAAIGRISGLLNLILGVPALIAPPAIALLAAAVGVRNTFAVLAAVALSAFPHLLRLRPKRRSGQPN